MKTMLRVEGAEHVTSRKTESQAERADALQGLFRSLPTDLVRYGPGTVERLPEDVDRLGGKRVFVITSRSIAGNAALLGRIEALLGGRYAGNFSGVRPHVPAGDVFAAAEAARRQNADLLVGLGGGSAIDCAKLVAFVLAGGAARPEKLCRLAMAHEWPEIGATIPQIAISTTLSAAEFSCAAGITDEASRVKGVLAVPRLVPQVIVLDPRLTLSTPRELWLSTGIKALDHAVERLCAVDHQPYIDALCLEAARILIENLRASAGVDEAAVAARGRCQVGAWLSFSGWLNVRTGLSHVIGHQIGARFGVPHGFTSGVTLPHVIRHFHARNSPGQFVLLARALGIDPSPDTAPGAIADIVAGLVADFALPSTLRALGVPREELAALAAAAFEEMKASGRLPAGRTAPDVESVVQAVW